MRTIIRCLLLAILAASVPPAMAEDSVFPRATPESQGLSATLLKPLGDEIEGYVRAGTIVGGELLVIKNRKTVFHEAYGLRDREDKLPMERGTIFNIRSMTKPLTGAAVQILVHEGKLKLDDPVAKYLPGFDNDKSRAIVIRQLLEHRSGLPLTNLLAGVRTFKDLQAQANAAGEKGPQFKPGEKFWYSDAGSDAAAAVVEKVTGTTIDRFVTERLLKPLGMADSFYGVTKDDPHAKRMASLYIGTPGRWTRHWKPGGEPMYPFAWGSQTLYSTAADYARFLTMWLDGGKVGEKQVLSKEAVGRILKPTIAMTMLGRDTPFPTRFSDVTVYYGEMSVLHAIGAAAEPAKVVAFGHSGSDGTAAWAFPAEDLIICYFTQSRGQSTVIRLEAAIERQLMRNGAAPPVPDALKPYLGKYYANFGAYKNVPFEVLFERGHLAMDIPGQLPFELKEPTKEGRWVLAISDQIAVSFKKDEAGKVTGLTLFESGLSFDLPKEAPAKEPEKK